MLIIIKNASHAVTGNEQQSNEITSNAHKKKVKHVKKVKNGKQHQNNNNNNSNNSKNKKKFKNKILTDYFL